MKTELRPLLLVATLGWPSPGAATPPPPKRELPRFDAVPFTDEKTPLPTLEEWKPVAPVALSDPLRSDCNAYRVREWIKIHCTALTTCDDGPPRLGLGPRISGLRALDPVDALRDE
jgi:hypothetical protein